MRAGARRVCGDLQERHRRAVERERAHRDRCSAGGHEGLLDQGGGAMHLVRTGAHRHHSMRGRRAGQPLAAALEHKTGSR